MEGYQRPRCPLSCVCGREGERGREERGGERGKIYTTRRKNIHVTGLLTRGTHARLLTCDEGVTEADRRKAGREGRWEVVVVEFQFK